MRAVLVYNPKSGRQASERLLEEVVELLRAGGFETTPRPTRGPGDAAVLAREAAAEGADVVFAMGGDGTIRETAAGLIRGEAALGLLPAGTANVLSISLEVPGAALGAALAYSRGSQIREIDVGRAGDEPFLMMVSGGLDGRVMARQDSELKRRFGKLSFVLSGLREWWNYDFPPVALRVDGEELKGTFFAVCNIPHYGGSFRMADADPSDGLLDLVVFQGRSRASLASFALRVALGGRHLKIRDVIVRRVPELEILRSPDIPLQLDGDVLSELKTPFRVGTNERLKVLVPKR